MIKQISQALSSGFTSKQIIDFLMKKFPEHKNKIQHALGLGFTYDQITKFLGGGRKALTEQPTSKTEYEQVRERRQQRQETVNKGALATGALALSPLASQAAGHALSRALPQSLQGLIPGTLNAAQKTMPSPSILPSQEPQSQAPIETGKTTLAQQPPMVNANNLAQTQTVSQPQGFPIKDILGKHGLLQHVDKLAKAGRDSNAIAAILYSRFPKEMSVFQKEAGKNMEDAIADYLAQQSPETIPKNVEKEITQPVSTINKGSVVATPEGIGEIKELRNGQALIDIDGKKHKVSEDELIESPLPEKDLADLYDDLISGIEKQTGKQVSRNVEWAGYDPSSNELAYKPHGSERFYVYDDIPEDVVRELTELMTQRRSTGSNYIGAWEKGTTSPIGSRMYDLIKKLQSERGGQGQEYRSRFESIYDALSPAKEAAKKRHEERKKKAKKSRAP